jgi:hypothetical protein
MTTDMHEKVARAIEDAISVLDMAQDGNLHLANTALAACHYEEIVTLLREWGEPGNRRTAAWWQKWETERTALLAKLDEAPPRSRE